MIAGIVLVLIACVLVGFAAGRRYEPRGQRLRKISDEATWNLIRDLSKDDPRAECGCQGMVRCPVHYTPFRSDIAPLQ